MTTPEKPTPEKPTPEKPINSKQPPHKSFQAAYDKYFRELGEIHEDTRRRFMDIQFEYLRKQNQAAQSQDLKALQEAFDEFQRSYNAAAMDTTPLKRYADAYSKYKNEVKKAVAAVDVDDLDSLSLAAIAQSASVVACAASQFGPPPKTDTADRAEAST